LKASLNLLALILVTRPTGTSNGSCSAWIASNFLWVFPLVLEWFPPLRDELNLGFYKEKNDCGRPCMMREAKCFIFIFILVFMWCVFVSGREN
jgi:hypothetical protein